MKMLPLHLSALLLFFILSHNSATCELVLESGYSVSTLMDFNKYEPFRNIHPYSLLPRRRSRDSVVLLDSKSPAFYSVPLPISQESEVSLLSGKGVAGLDDGDKTTAMFDKPRSFAIDEKDNIYVADTTRGVIADTIRGVIRKIDPSGVTTTIAGGYSEKTGHIDGPAQNASFSNNFDLVYVPNMCALLISDRATSLIRKLELKPQDCAQKTQTGLGVAPVSGIAVVCLLVGLILGFVARPFLPTREVFSNRFVRKTWKHYQTIPGRLLLTTYSGVRSAVASSAISQLVFKLVNLSLCYLSVVFRNISSEKRVQCGGKNTSFKGSSVCSNPLSLLEPDMVGDGLRKQEVLDDQLPDLINFNEGTGVLSSSEHNSEDVGPSEGNCCKIDDMMYANLLDLSNQPKQQAQGSTSRSAGLLQRRPMRTDGLRVHPF